MLNKKNNNIGIISQLIVLLSIMFSACSQPKLPECVKENERNIAICWGTLNNQTGQKNFYRLTGEAAIYYVEKDSSGEESVSKIKSISSSEFCEIRSKVQEIMVKKQSINFPADEQQFLEYRNPSKDVYYVSLWNAQFSNVGNKEFKEFYNKLNLLLKKK